MSEVKMVKRFLVGTSVSVLAGLLLSSAALAEDSAAPAGEGDASVSVDIAPEVCPEPALGEAPTVVGSEGSSSAETGDTEEGGEDGGVVDGGEVTVDPICADCSGTPEVTIDPIEMEGAPEEEGEVAVDPIDEGTEVPEVTLEEPVSTDDQAVDDPVVVYDFASEGRPTMPEARGEIAQSVARGDHGDGARTTGTGETPAWLKKLFKSN